MTTILKRLIMGLIFSSIVLTATPAQAISDNSKEFVAEVRADWPALNRTPARKIVRVGKAVCALLESGEDPRKIITVIKQDTGVKRSTARQFVRTSTEYYCYWMTPVV